MESQINISPKASFYIAAQFGYTVATNIAQSVASTVVEAVTPVASTANPEGHIAANIGHFATAVMLTTDESQLAGLCDMIREMYLGDGD